MGSSPPTFSGVNIQKYLKPPPSPHPPQPNNHLKMYEYLPIENGAFPLSC